MYGDYSAKLVNEAKRTQGLESLPLYQDMLVRNIVRETRDLERLTEALSQQQQESESDEASERAAQCQLFVAHLAMRRNKRCLLAYERQRSERLAQLVWEAREVKSSTQGIHIEQQYLHSYTDIVAEYKSAFPEIDLAGPLIPPKDVFIDVRVLKDAGEIQTEYGVFNLTKDSQFFVRKADVERLIQQGYLQKI